ncbi:MAG: BamA/TamA family outer membrane protein [Pseudomonadota bacterium]
MLSKQLIFFCKLIVNFIKQYRAICCHIVLVVLLFSSHVVLAADHYLHLDTKVTGLDKEALDNVNKRLKLMRTVPDAQLSVRQIKYYYHEGKKEIRQAISPYGYFKPTIHSTLTHKDNQWLATYDVTPGEQLRITDLSIKLTGAGATQTELQQLIKTLPLQQNAVFTSKRYNDSSKQLLSAAANLGYIKAQFSERKIIIDKQAYTCKIILLFNTGKRYYFGPVNFSSSPFKTSFLKRYLNFKPGEPYNYGKLLQLQQILLSTGYFQNVVVTPEVNQASNDNQVPIAVDVHKNKRKAYKIGVGYGTGTGPRAILGIDWRWVNSSGHHFSTDVQASELDNRFTAQYIIPGRHPSTEQYSLNASTFRLTPQKATSTGVRAGPGYITRYGNWKSVYAINYLYEHYRYDENGAYRTDNGIIPSVTFSNDKQNSPLNPSKANRFTITTSGSVKNKRISTISFAQINAIEQFLYPLTDNMRILLRGESGYTFVNKLTILPVSLSFYTGGAQSVRGYSNQSLGPGRYLLVASAELRQRIYNNFWGAAFIDEGNAFNSFKTMTFRNNFNLQRGIGVGLVWHSPVGAVALSLAQPKGGFGKLKSTRFQFSIGLL